jgi:hypothetical protein
MVRIRIRLGKETVKRLLELLRQAYKAGDVRLVRRASALLALSDGQPHAPRPVSPSGGRWATPGLRWDSSLWSRRWANAKPTRPSA